MLWAENTSEFFGEDVCFGLSIVQEISLNFKTIQISAKFLEINSLIPISLWENKCNYKTQSFAQIRTKSSTENLSFVKIFWNYHCVLVFVENLLAYKTVCKITRCGYCLWQRWFHHPKSISLFRSNLMSKSYSKNIYVKICVICTREHVYHRPSYGWIHTHTPLQSHDKLRSEVW